MARNYIGYSIGVYHGDVKHRTGVFNGSGFSIGSSLGKEGKRRGRGSGACSGHYIAGGGGACFFTKNYVQLFMRRIIVWESRVILKKERVRSGFHIGELQR